MLSRKAVWLAHSMGLIGSQWIPGPTALGWRTVIFMIVASALTFSMHWFFGRLETLARAR